MRREDAEVDHGADQRDHHHVHPLEPGEDLGHLGEEVGVVLLLGGRAPVHVDAEHVGHDGQEDVEGDAAEEDDEERHPLEVLSERLEQTLLAETVSQDRERDIGHDVEDKEERHEDYPWLVRAFGTLPSPLTLPRLDVVLVKIAVEPTNQDVVEHSERDR